ncbi:hypothetical protein B0H14DRAFT_2872333, partial [Mycena olivaceomarginata]
MTAEKDAVSLHKTLVEYAVCLVSRSLEPRHIFLKNAPSKRAALLVTPLAPRRFIQQQGALNVSGRIGVRQQRALPGPSPLRHVYTAPPPSSPPSHLHSTTTCMQRTRTSRSTMTPTAPISTSVSSSVLSAARQVSPPTRASPFLATARSSRPEEHAKRCAALVLCSYANAAEARIESHRPSSARMTESFLNNSAHKTSHTLSSCHLIIPRALGFVYIYLDATLYLSLPHLI